MKTLNLIALASVLCFAVNGFAQGPSSAKQTQSAPARSQAVQAPPAINQAAQPAAIRLALARIPAAQPVPALSSVSDSVPNAQLSATVVGLQAIFLQQNANTVADLVSPNGRVALYAEGTFQSSLGAADFAQMIADYSQAAETISLQVTSMQTRGGQATVRLTHQFLDMDMNLVTIYQTYLLKRVGPSYVIAAFMAASTPS